MEAGILSFLFRGPETVKCYVSGTQDTWLIMFPTGWEGAIFIHHQDLMQFRIIQFWHLERYYTFFFVCFLLNSHLQYYNVKPKDKRNETKKETKAAWVPMTRPPLPEKKMKRQEKDRLDTFSEVCSFCFKRHEAPRQITHSEEKEKTQYCNINFYVVTPTALTCSLVQNRSSLKADRMILISMHVNSSFFGLT